MSATSTRPVRPSRQRERRLPLNAPVRAWTLSEWALLPLRGFLGVTFLFAGLQKLANPNFFNAQSPNSIQAQLVASARVSPIHVFIEHLVRFATPLGIFIALGEVAIGIGAIIGLWTRVAAIGGALLSFSLFLTVSFHAAPYYTGADIVFTFAWLPFILAGSGSRFSLDGLIARRVAREQHQPLPDLVSVPFSSVQSICGHFTKGATCGARHGLPCEAAVCPVLLGPRAPLASRVEIDSVDRRTVVLGTAAAAAVGTSALIAGGVAAEAGRLIGGAPAPKKTSSQLGAGVTSTTAPASNAGSGSAQKFAGTLLGPAKDVPVGQAATFTIPSSGDPGIVLQPSTGSYVGYDAVCPHAGCTVGFYAANNLLVCPCHASEFQVNTGAVIAGPAPHGLTPLKIAEGPDGNLYLQ